MEWVTRERPKIDRIACPWLILRFIDAQAEFHYVPADRVLAMAQETRAIPYDIPGVELTHVGERMNDGNAEQRSCGGQRRHFRAGHI